MSGNANTPILLAVGQLNEATTNEALLALAAAINGPRPRPKLEEAMKIFNRDLADKINPVARRWAFNKWRNSEEECHLFVLMRYKEREANFEDLQLE